MIMAAFLVPVLIGVAALAVGATTSYVGKQDSQRTTDLGAVAAASNAPTVSVSGSAINSPLDFDGLTTTADLDELFDQDDWAETGCEVAKKQLQGDRSPILNRFRDQTLTPTCTTHWEYENSVIAALTACAANVLDVASCSSTLQSQLGIQLPAVNNAAVSALNTRAQALATSLNSVTGRTTSYLTSSLLTLLTQSCLRTVLGVCVLPNPLAGTFSTLWSKLGFSSVGNNPQLGFNLASIVPAIATPRVRITLGDVEIEPPFTPGSWGNVSVGADAVGRRTIKSALVLPSLGVPGVSSSLGASFGTEFSGYFGQSVANTTTLGVQAGVGGFVVDPNDLTTAVNGLTDDALGVLDVYEDVARGPVATALTNTVCPAASISCSVVSDPSAPNQLVQPFLADIEDATTPPPSGSAPTINEILGDHAASGEPILMVGALRRAPASLMAGSTTWDVLQSVIPGLSDLLFIPALDVVPATISQPIAGGPYVITPIASTTHDALATSGLYRGRLVE